MTRVVSLLIVPAIMLAGCANPPSEKLAAAEKAVEEARAVGAQTYAAEDFAKLEGLLTGAKQDMEEQSGKFAMLRDYEKTEQLLATAQADAGKVVATATKRKEEAKVAAAQAFQAAQESVQATQALVAKAPVGKDRAAVEAIKNDVQGLATSLTEVETTIGAGDYLAAQAKAKAIQDKSQAVAAEIQQAIDKVAAAKGKGGKAAKR